MSLTTPCTSCRKIKRGKPTSLYVSYSVNDDRVSYRQVLCSSCAPQFAEVVKDLKPLRNDTEDGEWPELCSGCGTKLGEDFSPTYLTVFEPRQPQVDLVLATCEPCALNMRPPLVKDAIRQQNRRTGDEGAPSSQRPDRAAPALAWA